MKSNLLLPLNFSLNTHFHIRFMVMYFSDRVYFLFNYENFKICPSGVEKETALEK